ncbi:MIP/aquaporin family protein [Robertmurraya korlensis]|uniref:MIP/aquaporin family protein n=1 Tax=Robertmurraya korlensis TaxID=519977 RepID=UPI000826EB5E|nr:MIP/aquaporin family protein [Robertmurraya korlensis]
MTAFIGELVGTAILIFIGCSVCAGASLKKSYSYNPGWFSIQFAWGFAVALAIFTVGKYSGAHLNPAVTLAFAFTGAFSWSLVPAYMVAQFIGAMIGAVAVFLHFFPHWQETEDANVKLGIFVTGPAIPHSVSNLASEMFATFVLVLSLLSIGATEFTKGLQPIMVGFLIITLGLSLGGTTGSAMNPARDFGPRIVHFLLPIPGKGGSNWKYAWIPVIGPTLGGCLGGFFYQAVFLGKMIPQLILTIGLIIIVLVGSHIVGLNTRKKSFLNSKIRKEVA